MTSTYVYFIIFACAGYLIVTDQSIAKAVFFVSQLIKNKFEIMKWWAMNNPKLPWVRYSMHRRSMKLAEELIKEYNEKQDYTHSSILTVHYCDGDTLETGTKTTQLGLYAL